jgi:hypothetical protein
MKGRTILCSAASELYYARQTCEVVTFSYSVRSINWTACFEFLKIAFVNTYLYPRLLYIWLALWILRT